MASIATIVTRGFGSFGGINLVPTLGFGISSAAALVYGPLRIAAADVFIPGAMAAECFVSGPQSAECFVPGAVAVETP